MTNNGRLLIKNCRVFGAKGSTSHRSIMIHDGRISRLSDQPNQSVSGRARELDVGGATVLPGLIDTHCHPANLGESRRVLDLSGVANTTALRLRLYSRVRKAPRGQWVVGRGWDQEAMVEKRYPDRSDVDDLAPENPVLLRRVCGHVGLLNSRGMTELGFDSPQIEADPALLGMDDSGRLTGIVKERALEEVMKRIPRWDQETVAGDLLTAEFEAARNGLTALHAVLSYNYEAELRALLGLHRAGKLGLRYRLYVPPEAIDFVEKAGLLDELQGEMLRLNGVKLFADGSLGARTAALKEPYADDPGNSGMLRRSPGELSELAERADSKEYQVVVHAIGDRGVEESFKALGPLTRRKNARRHRIEHCSLCPPEMARRLAEMRIGVTVQPHFIVSDVWAQERLGRDRVGWLYPLRTLLESGVVTSGSSDAPVEPISPLLGIWAAMVRGGFADAEKLDLEQGVAMYTRNAALNGFDERNLGEVREGAFADLTVLDSNIEGMHPAMLRKVGVAATIVAGKIVFSYEGAE